MAKICKDCVAAYWRQVLVRQMGIIRQHISGQVIAIVLAIQEQ